MDELKIIVVCQGTTAQWAANEARILESGEFGYNTDTREIKIGDGTSKWAALPACATKSDITPPPVLSVAGKTGAVALVKADVGLGNVSNTSDADKPVSTATRTALGKITAKIGARISGGNLSMTVADYETANTITI